MRLFIAISFSEEIKKSLWRGIRELEKEFPKVSWIKPDNIHLTLKFLGRVEESKLLEIKKAITESVKNVPSFKLSFTDFGYFDKGYLVVWLGVDQTKELLDLVGGLEKGIRGLGFPSEKRPYSPHVTLGRGKRLARESIIRLKDKIGELPSPDVASLLISEITLVQSTLSPDGALYHPIAKFALFPRRCMIKKRI